MYNSTTDVYATKREIINFSKSLVIKEKQVEAKFVTQLIYGILRSGSIILKNIGIALKTNLFKSGTPLIDLVKTFNAIYLQGFKKIILKRWCV